MLANLGLKAISLGLALLLWLVMSVRMPTEGYVTVRIEPTLDSSLALLDRVPDVRVLVAGRTADLVKLYAAPPVIRYVVDADAPDTLLVRLAPGDIRLAPDVADNVRVLDVQPRSVTLRFASRATRRVAVVNDARVTRDGGAAAVRFEPATVRISGARSAVRPVRALRPVPLSLSARDTLPRDVALDTAGLGVRATPAQVRLLPPSAPRR